MPSTTPQPGDLFVIPNTVDEAIEWLVVRKHPDDPTCLLIVPTDQFPLVGRSDCQHDGWRWTARCGQSAWVPAAALTERVGAVLPFFLRAVRNKLAALARGETGPVDGEDDADLEYEDHVARVEKARGEIHELSA